MSKYTEIVKKLFAYTENEPFMGGELYGIDHITEDIIFINSQHRMDANMIATLTKRLNGKLIQGNVQGDVLIFKCGEVEE